MMELWNDGLKENETKIEYYVLNLSLTGSNRYIFDANQIISFVFIRFWLDEE